MNDSAIGHVRLDWRVARVAAASVVFLAMLPLIRRGATAADGDVSVNFAADTTGQPGAAHAASRLDG